MKTMVTGSKFVPGKVVIGPKSIDGRYFRIVSQRDRSGRIEMFDCGSRSWIAAPEEVAFIDVWKAPDAAQLFVDLAGVQDTDWPEDLEAEDALAGPPRQAEMREEFIGTS